MAAAAQKKSVSRGSLSSKTESRQFPAQKKIIPKITKKRLTLYAKRGLTKECTGMEKTKSFLRAGFTLGQRLQRATVRTKKRNVAPAKTTGQVGEVKIRKAYKRRHTEQRTANTIVLSRERAFGSS